MDGWREGKRELVVESIFLYLFDMYNSLLSSRTLDNVHDKLLRKLP